MKCQMCDDGSTNDALLILPLHLISRQLIICVFFWVHGLDAETSHTCSSGASFHPASGGSISCRDCKIFFTIFRTKCFFFFFYCVSSPCRQAISSSPLGLGYSLCPFLFVVFDVHVITLIRFVENACNIYISK